MKKHFLLLTGVLCALHSGAQSVGPSTLNSAGKSSNIGPDTYEWSVGEMAVVSTYTSGSLVVTQGVLQPFDAALGVPANNRIAKNLNMFPNPAQDVLFLQPAFQPGTSLSYSLQAIDGKVLRSATTQLPTGSEKQTLQLNALAAGNYMLLVQVTENGRTFTNNYKIEKLH